MDAADSSSPNVQARRACIPYPTAATPPPAPVAAPLTGVAGLLFEPEGVLCDGTLWRRWLLNLLRRMGLFAHYDAFYRLWDCQYAPDVYSGRCDFRAAMEQFLRSAGLSAALVSEVVAAARAERKRVDVGDRPLPSVSRTLSVLASRGYALGVSSDCEWTSAELAHRLVRLGIGSRLPVVVSSRDLRRTKPDPVCYQTAAERLGLPVESVVYVASSAEHLSGARRVGMRTIGVGPGEDVGGDVTEDVATDRRVARFEQLADMLAHPSVVRRAS